MAEKKPAKKAATKQTAKTAASVASGTEPASARTAAAKPGTKKSAKKTTTKKTTTKKATGKKTVTKQAVSEQAPKQQAPKQQASKQQTPEQLAERASTLAVREDESPWSLEELQDVLLELQADADRLRAEILDAENELDDLLHNSGDGAGDDQADAGSKTFEREHEMSLAANARDMLAQTERATDRIKAGTYGNCEGCGQPIGKERLRAYPRATLCVSCKQREERR